MRPISPLSYEAIATRLLVDERALRDSIDEGAPQPRIEVLTAVARYYGVDPSWLVTGAYNPSTHRAAAFGAGNDVRQTIRELMAE